MRASPHPPPEPWPAVAWPLTRAMACCGLAPFALVSARSLCRSLSHSSLSSLLFGNQLCHLACMPSSILGLLLSSASYISLHLTFPFILSLFICCLPALVWSPSEYSRLCSALPSCPLPCPTLWPLCRLLLPPLLVPPGPRLCLLALCIASLCLWHAPQTPVLARALLLHQWAVTHAPASSCEKLVWCGVV